jgi:hypothetical protein
MFWAWHVFKEFSYPAKKCEFCKPILSTKEMKCYFPLHAMKAYVRVDEVLQSFLTSALDGSEKSSLLPSRFLPEETALLLPSSSSADVDYNVRLHLGSTSNTTRLNPENRNVAFDYSLRQVIQWQLIIENSKAHTASLLAVEEPNVNIKEADSYKTLVLLTRIHAG